MKILLAVDGSLPSTWATNLARKLPLTGHAEIVIMHVVFIDPVTEKLLSRPVRSAYSRAVRTEVNRLSAAAKPVLARVAAQLRPHFAGIRTVLEVGQPADRIIARAKEERSDLIIVGSRGLGRMRRLLLGSVAQKVSLHAPCSVLVAKASSRTIKRVLTAFDGSEYSKHAIQFVRKHVRLKDVRVTAVYAWPQPLPLYLPKMVSVDIEEQTRKLFAGTGPGTKVGFDFVYGHPVQRIIDVARDERSDLIVVGARGLSPGKRLLLGSVSQGVLLHSPVSVLIVRALPSFPVSTSGTRQTRRRLPKRVTRGVEK
jgi:nucleotide-binding universal stress UspA family protein